MKPRPRLAATMCLLALACACGSRARLTRPEYERQVTVIGKRFTDTLQDVFSSPALQSPESLKAPPT